MKMNFLEILPLADSQTFSPFSNFAKELEKDMYVHVINSCNIFCLYLTNSDKKTQIMKKTKQKKKQNLMTFIFLLEN